MNAICSLQSYEMYTYICVWLKKKYGPERWYKIWFYFISMELSFNRVDISQLIYFSVFIPHEKNRQSLPYTGVDSRQPSLLGWSICDCSWRCYQPCKYIERQRGGRWRIHMHRSKCYRKVSDSIHIKMFVYPNRNPSFHYYFSYGVLRKVQYISDIHLLFFASGF